MDETCPMRERRRTMDISIYTIIRGQCQLPFWFLYFSVEKPYYPRAVPITSRLHRSKRGRARILFGELSLFSLFPPLDISPTYPSRKMEVKWPRGVRSADCQRDNAPRCCTAKVLSVRVYIGRSRKRWISTVSRPRAKLLRDVFVVSFAGVCGLWRNHGPVRRQGARQRDACWGGEGLKSWVGWKPSRTILRFHVPSKRTTHPIIVSSRQGALSIDTRAIFFFVYIHICSICIRFNETRRIVDKGNDDRCY